MSDTMQFIRELLEGKEPTVGIKGIITHVIRVYSPEPVDPVIYEFQMEVNGFLYSDFGCTRDPDLRDMKVGDEILCFNAAPEAEGYPTFLLLKKVQAESVTVPITAEEETEATTAEFNEPDPAPFNADARDAEEVAETQA